MLYEPTLIRVVRVARQGLVGLSGARKTSDNWFGCLMVGQFRMDQDDQ